MERGGGVSRVGPKIFDMGGGHGNGELTLKLLRLSINVEYFYAKKGGRAPSRPPSPSRPWYQRAAT